MKAKSIAKVILADHRRERSERTDITKCFMCGYGVAFVLTAAVSITSKAIRVTFRIGCKPR